MMHNKKLRQPKKHTRAELDSKSQQQQDMLQPTGKTKQINKKYQKKTINKLNQPSALRLEKINETFQKLLTEAPKLLTDLSLSQSLDPLLQLKGRKQCNCKKNVKYYCLKCFQNFSGIPFPKVNLPMNLTILHHEGQNINKSSCVPMRLLSQNVEIIRYQNKTNEQTSLQDYEKLSKLCKKTTYILYPHPKSKTIQQVSSKEMNNLIVLDCTWFQTDNMIDYLLAEGFSDENFVRLDGYKSVYWRYNHHNDQALSSAEAIMYFFREYCSAKKQENIKKYDDLMFLYGLSLHQVLKQQKNRQNQIQNGQKDEKIQSIEAQNKQDQNKEH